MSEIVHTGVIEAIENGKAFLKIAAKGCENCALRGACGPASQPERRFTADLPEDKKLQVGQSVDIVLTSSQIAHAAFWGYIAPLILMLAALVAVLPFGGETWAATVSLGIVPVYYFILWLCRKRLKKILQIKVR